MLSLVIGIVFPVATFMNMQGLTSDSDWDCPLEGTIWFKVMSSMSMVCGVVGTASLCVRMLEKKIKWSFKFFIAASLAQGAISTALGLLLAQSCGINHLTVYSLVCGYIILFCINTSFLSVAVWIVARHILNLNASQAYVYNLYDLTPNMRQLILAVILNLSMISVSAIVYSFLEDWRFGDAIYFCTSTFATIGLGDFYPTTAFSKAILPIFATSGIVLLGALVYATRNVVLELVAQRLAKHLSEYSKSNPQLVEMHVDSRIRRYSTENMHPSVMPTDYQTSEDIEARKPLLKTRPSNARPSANNPTMLRPVSSRFIERSTSAYDALDLANTLNPTKAVTISVSRTGDFPNLTLQAAQHTSPSDINASTAHVIEVTRSIFLFQLLYALLALVLNMTLFAWLFSELEEWNYWDGLYFSYCVLTSIGFGDKNLTHAVSKSLFIWHIVVGVVSLTYFSSMIAERALDLWTVEVGRIENRVSRYETKATLKKLYSGDNISDAGPSHNFGDVLVVAQDEEECEEDDFECKEIQIPTSKRNAQQSYSYEKHKILSYTERTRTRGGRTFE